MKCSCIILLLFVFLFTVTGVFAGPLQNLNQTITTKQIGEAATEAQEIQTAPSVSADTYTARAEKAKEKGITTLVIAFEGLMSHSSSATKNLLNYQDKIRDGKKASTPNPVAMNFIAKHLLKPYLSETKNRAEFVTFSEASQNKKGSPAEKCAVAWHKQYGPPLNLIVVGHSFGGYAAIKLCKRLNELGIPVDHMLTMDARTTPGNYKNFIKPPNVASAHNFFQKSLFMPGYEIKGATNTKVKGIDHGHMPGGEQVKKQFAKMLAAGSDSVIQNPTPPVEEPTSENPPTEATTPTPAPPSTDDVSTPPTSDKPASGLTNLFSGFKDIFKNIGNMISDFLGNLFKK